MSVRSTITHVSELEANDGYPALEDVVRRRVAAVSVPVFETAADDLFLTFLAGLPEHRHQHYVCHACRRFFERYGGLVSVGEDGATQSVLWGAADLPGFFADALAAVRAKVERAKVAGVFLCGDKVWGRPVTGTWTHLSGVPDPTMVFTHPLKTAGQVMAEKREDFVTLKRGLAEFPAEAVEQAVKVLEADALDRGEKTLGVARWLLQLHRAIGWSKGPARDNLVWRAVATAPPGWCHVRSTMIGTLLDDIVTGLPFDSIKARWAAKMHPLQYQRPTASPSAGAIAQAEKVVAQLDSAGALRRRFARLEDILAFLWRPAAEEAPAKAEKPAGGVFDHLKGNRAAVKPVELPAAVMTWEKFQRTVLPGAAAVEFLVPSGQVPFYGMVTAADPEAPPILQWDGLEGHQRNPASWYFYHGGSYAANWNLSPGSWCKVNAACLAPPAWQEPEKFKHQGDKVFFVLEGCRDLRHERGGGFFPECLRSEYHGVRSVMEAYVQSATIAGKDEGTANGVALQRNGGDWGLTVRVRSAGGLATYRLDRWD